MKEIWKLAFRKKKNPTFRTRVHQYRSYHHNTDSWPKRVFLCIVSRTTFAFLQHHAQTDILLLATVRDHGSSAASLDGRHGRFLPAQRGASTFDSGSSIRLRRRWIRRHKFVRTGGAARL